MTDAIAVQELDRSAAIESSPDQVVVRITGGGQPQRYLACSPEHALQLGARFIQGALRALPRLNVDNAGAAVNGEIDALMRAAMEMAPTSALVAELERRADRRAAGGS